MKRRVICVLLTLLLLLSGMEAIAAGELFPPADVLFGVTMPDIRFAVDREPDSIATTEEGELLTCRGFTAADYEAFGRYAAAEGLELVHSEVLGNVLTAELAKNGKSIRFQYNYDERTASLLYPNGVRREQVKSTLEISKSVSILPDFADTFSVAMLPRVSTAILRYPDQTSTTEDGGLIETYQNFTEAEYTAFSGYLLETGCAVSSYHIDAAGALVIPLELQGSGFTLVYDQLGGKATVMYPNEAQVEPEIPESALPTPTPKSTPTPRPESAEASEYTCWRIAEQYFRNLNWKNPSSVTIHGYNSTITDGGDSYLFSIDYSAQNGFGGYNREVYLITVNRKTCSVTAAFGS